MKKLPETNALIFKTCGLLNFLGGRFNTEEVEKMEFGILVDTIIRNGGVIVLDVQQKESQP